MTNEHPEAQSPPTEICSAASRRRSEAAVAGHRLDEASARGHLLDPAASVRATALNALARSKRLMTKDLVRGLSDPDPTVRRRSCEITAREARAGRLPEIQDVCAMIVDLLEDPDELVCEAAAWALGEIGERADVLADNALSMIAAVATGHRSALCREAAVAALGALGDPSAIPSVLAALHDQPSVRRRAVVALAPFEHPDVLAALQDCLNDRDWQVRESARELLATP